jgi:hypothetical protein
MKNKWQYLLWASLGKQKIRVFGYLPSAALGRWKIFIFCQGLMKDNYFLSSNFRQLEVNRR